MGPLPEQNGERFNPLAASPTDSSGEAAQDKHKDQLKQITLSHHLFRDFEARIVVCMN